MGSVNDEEHNIAKPKIDLLLQEINEVKNRENEYLAHIRSLYPEKFNDVQPNTRTEEPTPLDQDVNDSNNTINDVNDKQTLINISTSAKNLYTSKGHASPNAFQFSHTKSNSSKGRIFQTTNKKGIMHQFYTSRGKISEDPHILTNMTKDSSTGSLSVSLKSKIQRDDSGKPIRKGYIPVEEKIHQELKDLQNREKELKLLRKQKYRCKDSDDSDTEYEVQLNGKIRPSKSIGEIYEALWQSNTKSTVENCCRKNGIKNSVSLAQLCDLDDDENDVISSHKLIEKWECLIQERKQ